MISSSSLIFFPYFLAPKSGKSIRPPNMLRGTNFLNTIYRSSNLQYRCTQCVICPPICQSCHHWLSGSGIWSLVLHFLKAWFSNHHCFGPFCPFWSGCCWRWWRISVVGCQGSVKIGEVALISLTLLNWRQLLDLQWWCTNPLAFLPLVLYTHHSYTYVF